MDTQTNTVQRRPIPDVLAPASYDLDDLQSDIGHLCHLLDALAAAMNELDYGEEGNRNFGLDRANAFVWIARDMAERSAALIDVHFHQIGCTTKTWVINADLAAPGAGA